MSSEDHGQTNASSQMTSPLFQDRSLPAASLAIMPRAPPSDRYTVTDTPISVIASSPALLMNVSKFTSSPANSVCCISPVCVSVVVALGDSILTTSASGPIRPSASIMSFCSSSVQSSATSEVLASIKMAKIIGVNLLIVISSKRVGRIPHAM